MKTCSKCLTEKSIDNFLACRGYKGGRRSYCNECAMVYSRRWQKKNQETMNEKTRAWRKANPEIVKEVARASRLANLAADPDFDRRRNLRKNYGITIEQYDGMYIKQNGVCGICSRVNLSGRRLAVDHDHATGKVRGLLCSRCNSAIGLARESLDVLKKTVLYLEKHETLSAIGAL